MALIVRNTAELQRRTDESHRQAPGSSADDWGRRRAVHSTPRRLATVTDDTGTPTNEGERRGWNRPAPNRPDGPERSGADKVPAEVDGGGEKP